MHTEDKRFPLPTVPSQDDWNSDPKVWDLIVVGAGVAGSAFAYTQAKDGRRVLLLERDLSQPDRIVGELLQPGGFLALKKMGLEHCVEDIDASKVYGYALFKNGHCTVLKYPIEGTDIAGRSFHHGRFIQNLRGAAAAHPKVTIRQGIVKRLVNGDGGEWQEGQVVTGVVYKGTDDAEHTAVADLTVVCDGMYSSFRKKLSDPNKLLSPSFFVGLMLTGVALPHPNHGHVVLAKPSPILFYPISSKEVRCLVDVPGVRLPSQLPQYLRDIVAPEVPEELRPAFLRSLEETDIRSMQNKQLTAAPLHVPGALLLGDAFNMRHPLTGGGMTVALSDTYLLCNMLKPLANFSNAMATSRQTADFYVQRKPISATINTLANALYEVFCYRGDPAHEEMRSACFDYLSLGGMHSAGPISLLSGLNPSPRILVMHFFMVALYGVGRLVFPRPTFKGLWMSLLLLLVAVRIILPIIYSEGPVAIFLPWLARQPSSSIKKVKSMQSLSHSKLN